MTGDYKSKNEMNDSKLRSLFSSIRTFEEYEECKSNIGVFEYAAKEIIQQHHLIEASLTLFYEGTNIVFAYGDHHVIKIFPPFHFDQFNSERLVLKHLQGKLSIQTPMIEYDGEIAGWPYIVMTQLEGTLLETLWQEMDHNNKIIIMRELGMLIREVHSLPIDGLEEIDCHWDRFIENQRTHCIEQHQSTGLSGLLLAQIPSYVELERLPKIKKPVILTGEYTPMNFLVKKVDGVWHIEGLIDFGDAMLGLPEYDLLGPGAFLIQGDKGLLHTFLTAYGYLPDMLSDELSYQLTVLMLLHKYSNLNVQVRIQDWKQKVSNIGALQHLVWGFGNE